MQILPRPIFIVGPQRSGTTLLRLMLDSHPEIAMGPETGFMRAAAAIKQIPDWPAGDRWYESYGLSEDDLEQRIATFYGEIFSTAAVRQGKSRWGEKTPFHRFAVPEMARMFPDSQFIGVLRHAGAVLASRKRWRTYDPQPVLRDWVQSTETMFADRAELADERYHIVRYESLVRSPRVVLGQLLSYLDVRWSEAVLRHHVEQPAKGAPAVSSGGTRTGTPLHTMRLDRWREELSSDEMRLVSTVAGAALRTSGYGLTP